MGQKVNPHGLRVGVIKNWDSRWYAPDEKFGDTLVNDYKIREYVKKTLFQAGIPQVEIERSHNGAIKVYVHCAKPGMVIGSGGAGINKLREDISKIAGQSVSVDVLEVKPVDMCAQLVAENIASQLERRISFRRAMKQSIRNTMRLGAKGIKINLNGRIGGAEIARTEHYHEGTIPLQTIRADIDYGFAEANTTYGKIGCKVWIYKGEVLSEVARTKTGADERRKPRTDDRRNGQRRDRRDGDRRDGDRRNPQRRDSQRDSRFGDNRRPRTAPNGQPVQNARPAAPAPKKEGGAD
jgi:small subunit ribosomal protein S3